jgi:hypothetical protein
VGCCTLQMLVQVRNMRCEAALPHVQDDTTPPKSLHLQYLGLHTQIPVSEGGTIKGSDLGKIKAGGDGVGLRMYDPGYVNTTAVISKICFIDGNKGILRYRGYPIEEVRSWCLAYLI